MRSFIRLVSCLALLAMLSAGAFAKTGQCSLSGSTWTGKVDSTVVYTGTDMIACVQAAINNLTSGRTTKETVYINNSGSTGNASGSVKAINIASYTILDFKSHTVNVNDTTALVVPVQGNKVSNIEIKNLIVTGAPRYGIWLKTCTNMTLSGITMNLSHPSAVGIGIRVDNSGGDWSKNLTLGDTTITGSLDNAVETYGLDGFTIGTVNATDCGACGLLLNYSKNGTVKRVNGTRCGQGTGYAAFRVANSNGPSVTCSYVYARSCGRGFFSVSGSQGCTVTYVDIANCEQQGVLMENATNTAVKDGTISNCGAEGVRLAQSSTYCTARSLVVSGCTYGVRETSPADYNTIMNNTLSGNGTALAVSGAHTTVQGNTY